MIIKILLTTTFFILTAYSLYTLKKQKILVNALITYALVDFWLFFKGSKIFSFQSFLMTIYTFMLMAIIVLNMYIFFSKWSPGDKLEKNIIYHMALSSAGIVIYSVRF